MITLFNMDVMKALKNIDSESVNCLMTSPPYWALRDYGSSVESTWDGDNNCEHEWGTEIITSSKCADATISGTIEYHKKSFSSSSSFCSKCGAWKGQIGLEPTFDLYIKHLCDIFDEVKRVLRKDGTCWVNLGDTYGTKSGSGFANDNLNPLTKEQIAEGTGIYKANELRGTSPGMHKNLCNIPARFSIEMQNRGWILRNVIIWHKPNCMPSSVKDRFTVDFEYLYFFVKSKKYWFETQYEPHKLDSIKRACRARESKKLDSGQYSTSYKQENSGYENMMGRLVNGEIRGVGANGRNKRTVWTITTKPFKEAHFATYPEALCETPIRAGCPEFVCNKCGKPREKIIKYGNLKEDGHGKLIKKDEPYSVQHREGEILVRDLPEQKEILEYLRKAKNISLTEISKIMNLPPTTCSHWFSDLDSTHGFSYPTKEQWVKLKEILKFDNTFDDEMTKEYYKPAGVMDNKYKETGLTDCGCNAGFNSGVVLDIFAGSGTTLKVARDLNRNSIGIELNPEYCKIIEKRLFNGNKPLDMNSFKVIKSGDLNG